MNYKRVYIYHHCLYADALLLLFITPPETQNSNLAAICQEQVKLPKRASHGERPKPQKHPLENIVLSLRFRSRQFQFQFPLFTMLISLTVGKIDAGVAVLLTQDNRLVGFFVT